VFTVGLPDINLREAGLAGKPVISHRLKLGEMTTCINRRQNNVAENGDNICRSANSLNA
jgi:hypothetical protein